MKKIKINIHYLKYNQVSTDKYSNNKTLIYEGLLIDFNGMSTHQGLFYA